jgi:hypothetical protein
VENKTIATLLLEEWEDDSQTFETGTWESAGTPKTSEFDFGVKTPRIEAFFISLKIYQNVDVENELA